MLNSINGGRWLACDGIDGVSLMGRVAASQARQRP